MSGPPNEAGRRWEAVLLAAGASTRMGRHKPKALLRWCGRTLLEHQTLELLATRVRRVVIVLGAHRERLLPVLERGLVTLGGQRTPTAGERIVPVVNAEWAKGKCGSIRAGVRALTSDVTDLALVAVDQPVKAEVLEAIFAAHERGGKQATAPVFAGRRGHPTAFAASQIDALQSLTEETLGLRALMRRLEAADQVLLQPVAAPSITWNFNRMSDIPRALEVLR